jgi:hydrogenase expression/formation protein HypE
MSALFEAGIDVHFARDPTRGGVSAVLQELTRAVDVTALVEEQSLPISPAVRGASEILGLDPIHIANEGKVILIVPPDQVNATLACLHSTPLGRAACKIGEIRARGRARVLIRSRLGVERVLDEPNETLLPRIC